MMLSGFELNSSRIKSTESLLSLCFNFLQEIGVWVEFPHFCGHYPFPHSSVRQESCSHNLWALPAVAQRGGCLLCFRHGFAMNAVLGHITLGPGAFYDWLILNLKSTILANSFFFFPSFSVLHLDILLIVVRAGLYIYYNSKFLL